MDYSEIVDREIEQGRRRGLFDNLRGHGLPIKDLGQQRADGWWAVRFVRNDRAQARNDDLERELAMTRRQIWRAESEADVGELVGWMNSRIIEHNGLSRGTDIERMAEMDLQAEINRYRTRQSPAEQPLRTRWWNRRWY